MLTMLIDSILHCIFSKNRNLCYFFTKRFDSEQLLKKEVHRQSFNVIGSANRQGHLYFNVLDRLHNDSHPPDWIRVWRTEARSRRGWVHIQMYQSTSCMTFHTAFKKKEQFKHLSSEVLARSSTAPAQPSLQVPSAVCWFSFTPTSASSAPAAWGRPLPALLKHLENSHGMRELIWRGVPLSTLPAQLTFCSKGRQVRSVHRRTKCWWRRGSWRWRDLEIRAAACQENAGGELEMRPLKMVMWFLDVRLPAGLCPPSLWRLPCRWFSVHVRNRKKGFFISPIIQNNIYLKYKIYKI